MGSPGEGMGPLPRKFFGFYILKGHVLVFLHSDMFSNACPLIGASELGENVPFENWKGNAVVPHFSSVSLMHHTDGYIVTIVVIIFQNFSAIVGPNGSGKSNVIDSMLFVFGYRASKIRSKKISVLIHSSDQQLVIDSCTVSVHFQKIIDHGVCTQLCPLFC